MIPGIVTQLPSEPHPLRDARAAAWGCRPVVQHGGAIGAAEARWLSKASTSSSSTVPRWLPRGCVLAGGGGGCRGCRRIAFARGRRLASCWCCGGWLWGCSFGAGSLAPGEE
eukprot:2786802-Pyramimonas_sp.AAC.1